MDLMPTPSFLLPVVSLPSPFLRLVRTQVAMVVYKFSEMQPGESLQEHVRSRPDDDPMWPCVEVRARFPSIHTQSYTHTHTRTCTRMHFTHRAPLPLP